MSFARSRCVSLNGLGLFVIATLATGECLPDPFSAPKDRWTFSAATPAGSIAGQFVATPKPPFRGIILITSTHVRTEGTGVTVTRSDNGTGHYLFTDSGCTQGIIFMNLGWFPVHFNFSLAPDPAFGNVIVLRSPGLSNPAAGTAWQAPGNCVGGQPDPGDPTPTPADAPIALADSTALQSLTGSYRFSLRTAGGTASGTLLIGPPWPPDYLNRGSLTVIPDLPGSAPTSAYTPHSSLGQYTVSPDCQRGTINFNNVQINAFQYDFYARISVQNLLSYVLIGGGSPANASTGTLTR
jgi:hypothetical protein